MVCNQQIINWGMPGLPSVVYGTAVQLPLLATCRWIMRRSWGRLLLVLLKLRMVGELAACSRCISLLWLWKKGGHIGPDGDGSKLLLLLTLFLRTTIWTQ
jgi:hypothetical protein